MANIFLSVPILDKPELKMIHSLYQAILSCREHTVRVHYNENDSLISRVRNVHGSAFLDDFTECDYFMSIDSDLEILNVFPNNNIFSKLISHNLDFVGGVYAIKNPKAIRSASIFMDMRDPPNFDSGLSEIRWLSSGCWCIKRKVFEELRDGYPELIYDGDDNAVGKKIYGFYIPYIYDMYHEDFPEVPPGKVFRKYLSEDWAFAQRWRELNPKNTIWCDTSIALKHYGKYAYSLWDFVVETKPKNKDFNKKINLPKSGFDLVEEIEKGNIPDLKTIENF